MIPPTSDRGTTARRRRRLWLRGTFGAALALGLLAWFLLRVDPAAVGEALAGVRPVWVAAAAFLQVGALALRGVRWRSLLARVASPPLASVLAATFMGWVALVVVPARLGDLARPWFLARRHALDRSYAFGAQQLERVFDLVGVLVLLGAYLGSGAPGLSPLGSTEWRRTLERGEAAVLVLVVALLVGLVAALAAAPRLERAVAERLAGHRASERWVRLASRIAAFLHGLTAVRTWRLLAVASVQSAGLWLAVLGAHLCLFRAFALSLPTLAVVPVVSLIIVGALVPTPAAIGSYHAAAQAALASLLGLPLAVATGYALVAHAVAYLPNLTIGTILLVRESAGGEEAS